MENEILNFSRVQEDPFADLSLTVQNSTESQNDIYVRWHPTTIQIIMNYVFIVLELGKFFLCIGSVLADILLIYLILRYKRLRKTYNLYIVHYAILNLCYFVLSPIFLLVHALVSTRFYYFVHMYCYLGMTEVTCLFFCFVFALLLGIDWTVSCFRPNYIRKIQSVYKYKFTISYLMMIIILIVNSFSCVLGHEFAHDLFLYSMPIFIVILIVLHKLRRQKILSNEHLKTEYSLWICTIAIGCYIPVFVLDLVFRMFNDSNYSIVIMILFLFEYICSFLATPAPIFVLYYLNKWNKHVKMAYDITFKKAVRTYGADNLDDASDNEEIVEEGDKNAQNNVNGNDTHTIMVP